MAKKFNLSLMWPDDLLPHVWWVSHMPFGELSCKQLLFSGLFSMKSCSVDCTVYSGHKDRCTSLLQAASGLPSVSLLLLWLMPSLLGLWVLVVGPLLAGLLWCHILSILWWWINGAGLHGGVVVSTVASQQEGSWFESWLGPFSVEFACSPRACVGSLRVRWLPPTAQKHAC